MPKAALATVYPVALRGLPPVLAEPAAPPRTRSRVVLVRVWLAWPECRRGARGVVGFGVVGVGANCGLR
jgi:hypothetical protein